MPQFAASSNTQSKSAQTNPSHADWLPCITAGAIAADYDALGVDISSHQERVRCIACSVSPPSGYGPRHAALPCCRSAEILARNTLRRQQQCSLTDRACWHPVMGGR